MMLGTETKKKKTRLLLAVLLWIMVPLGASAHAIPVSTSPESSALLDTVPAEVTIRFSERIDHKASVIDVTGPRTTMRSDVTVDPNDPRSVSVPVTDEGDGTYSVSWNVVSSDDGHFTKGTYAFLVGEGVIPASTPTAEVVAINTAPEALGMTAELLGHGLIWGVLILTALAIRPRRDLLTDEISVLRTGSAYLMAGAAFLVIGGALAQILIKGGQLSDLQNVSIWSGVLVYISTTAGTSTMVRMIMGAVATAAFIFGRQRIFSSPKFTLVEGLCVASMAVFALSRAIVSHATANPFLPPLSTAINFLHVIEKDLWFGLVLILLLLVVRPELKKALDVLLPRLYAILNLNFAFISVTATYIVWLHLKKFDNLFTTAWGVVFIELLLATALLVMARVYHVLSARGGVRIRFLPFTLGIELAAAVLVVYFSSLVIITSPPLLEPPTPVLSEVDQGVEVSLSRYGHVEGMLLLTTTGGAEPVVTASAEEDPTPRSIELTKQFEGGYVFPESILPQDDGQVRVTVVAPQGGGYDGHVSFSFDPNTFSPAPGWEPTRTLDLFTVILIIIVSVSVLVAYMLHRLMPRSWSVKDVLIPLPITQASLGAVLTLLIVTPLILAYGSSKSAHPFKALCEEDGNMWHLMQPMKNGTPVASVSIEGCMWGMGQNIYMFSDQREYDLYRSLPPAVVSLDHGPLVAGRPASFTISLREPDGTPAALFTDMEKLLHVVVVSEDQTEFAHIHPDESNPSYQEWAESSTFTLEHTFPKAGRYIISADYAHGLTLESKQFIVEISGRPAQETKPTTYTSPGDFGGYTVALQYVQPLAGELAQLEYTISKDGEPVTDLVPYLSAAMHVSVVKNDLSEFLHVHGEVHPPGKPKPPVTIREGKVVHSMENMITPANFGPLVEAHLIFPSAGLYTIWGEFKVGDTVVPTSFTVRVE